MDTLARLDAQAMRKRLRVKVARVSSHRLAMNGAGQVNRAILNTKESVWFSLSLSKVLSNRCKEAFEVKGFEKILFNTSLSEGFCCCDISREHQNGRG